MQLCGPLQNELFNPLLRQGIVKFNLKILSHPLALVYWLEKGVEMCSSR